MFELFADTSGWAAYLDRSDRDHEPAVRWLRRWQVDGRVVTTSGVLSELVAVLTTRTRLSRPTLLRATDAIRSAPWVEVVHIDAGLDAEAWGLLHRRPDKAWSLVDAASFVVMQRRGIVEALTGDRHFGQAGFVPLLGTV